MGRLKSFYHDLIVDRAEDPDPLALSAEPFLPDTCYVLMECDLLSGETKPLHVYTFRSDAEDALRLFMHGMKNNHIAEYLDYRITEVVQS